ncbi:histidine kinase [Bifidobacterium imperatoris]|uniref:Histidine protein kinase n=1 Tax=Bifidobacterium imperatoris TaxID=2020965 RepID=A0A2N5IRU3_9BIFI|nr:histidine kinase [Bifidobacterium imperatoris]PLS24674.1 histidine protein kinase [Bifidobacterium imperatoris]
MRQIRSAVNHLIGRIGPSNDHPVIAAACVLLAAALIAECMVRAATDAASTVSVWHLALVLVMLVGLIGGMFRPQWFLWAALVAGEILLVMTLMITPLAISIICTGFLAYLSTRSGAIATGMLLVLLVAPAPPSSNRLLVATLMHVALYCFPLVTGLLLHMMRQRDHDSYLLRRQQEREDTARNLHDTISNDLAYLILRIDHAETSGMPAGEQEYRRQLRELRDAANRAMTHTHAVIESLEEHPEQQPQSQPSEPRSTATFPLTTATDHTTVQQAELQSLIDDEEAKLESLGFTGDSLLGEFRRPLSPGMMRLLIGLLTELYANIAKHADPAEWYAVSIGFDAEEIRISVSDTIAEHDGKLGLGRGLDRYRTIVETAGGSFTIHTEQRHWQLDVRIPSKSDSELQQ